MVLTGSGVFWGVLEARPPPRTTKPASHTSHTTHHQSTQNPPTQKAHHSPPQKVCTENAKVCTGNLTKFPKYDTIKAVLVEINRTERGAQTPEKKTKQRKKGNYNETREKTRHHQGKHPRKISRPQLGSIQEIYSRRRNEMKTDLKASLLTKEVTRLKNKYPEARWWRLAELVRTPSKHQCGFRAEHENGRRILSSEGRTER